MDTNKKTTFNEQEMNKTTNNGAIPAASIINAKELKIPNVDLGKANETSTALLGQVDSQIASQNKQQSITEQKQAALQKQRTEQESLVSMLGDGTGITDKFNTLQEEVKPIEKDISKLTEEIESMRTQFNQQITDESGRRIAGGFVTGRQAIIEQRNNARLGSMSALLDAKNGLLSNAQNKIKASMDIWREVENSKIKQQEAKIEILKEITGETKEQEKADLEQRKLELEQRGKSLETLKKVIIDNAGSIPVDIARTALTSDNPDEALSSLLPYVNGKLEVKEINGQSYLLDMNTGAIVSDFGELTGTALQDAGVSGFYQKILSSSGGKAVDQSFIESWSKGLTVVSQLSNLNTLFEKKWTKDVVKYTDENGDIVEQKIQKNPVWEVISGRVTNKNIFSSDTKAIKTQLDTIVPTLARSIYGEVGVLTDQDFKKYAETLPNLKDTTSQQQAVMAMTLETVKNSMINRLQTEANGGRDVSGFVEDIQKIETQIGKIMTPIYLQNSPEVKSLISGGASKQEVGHLLQEGYSPTDIVELYTAETSNQSFGEGDIEKFSTALGFTESSGRYDARGPVIKNPKSMYNGQRALGKYQIMPGNLPKWSQEAIGRQVTEQEFMNSPELQEQIAKYQFDKIYKQHGNWGDVASIWHSGRTLKDAQNANDGLMATPTYVTKILSRMNENNYA